MEEPKREMRGISARYLHHQKRRYDATWCGIIIESNLVRLVCFRLCNGLGGETVSNMWGIQVVNRAERRPSPQIIAEAMNGVK